MKKNKDRTAGMVFMVAGVVIFLLTTIFFITNAKADSYCVDEYNLNTTFEVNVNGEITYGSYPTYCPAGCNNATFSCELLNAQMASNGMPLPLYIFLEAFSMVLFIMTFTNAFRVGKEAKIVMSVVCLVMFGFLAFTSFRIGMPSGIVVYNTPMVVINFLFAGLAIVSAIGAFFLKPFQDEQG